MDTDLYYFSGTGNSLSLAQSINNQIKGSNLYPIIGCLKQKQIQIKSHRVGIIFPIHFMTIPRIVKKFLEEIEFHKAQYVFVIVTGANPKLGNTLSQVEKYLNKKGVKLNAAYFIPMVAAHFPFIRTSKAKQADEIYSEAKEKVIQISQSIIQMKNEIDKEFSVLGNIMQLVTKDTTGNENYFSVGEGCIRCGYCMQVCPFQNIRLHGKQVHWLDNCHYCFACLHFCSQSVIEYKKLSVGKPRQHHPSVLLNDIALQREI